jgi:hypothetical protein
VRVRTLVIAALVTLGASVASADEAGREAPPLTFAVATGATLPAPSTRLGAGLSVGVDASWRPEFAAGWLAVVLDLDASQRTASGSGTQDGIAFDWRTVARELWIVPGLELRAPLVRGVSLSLGGGPALVLVSTVNGGALLGEPFADGRQASAILGLRGSVGAEWRVAGGALVLGASYGHARVSQRATGAGAPLDAIGVRVGYRFWF